MRCPRSVFEGGGRLEQGTVGIRDEQLLLAADAAGEHVGRGAVELDLAAEDREHRTVIRQVRHAQDLVEDEEELLRRVPTGAESASPAFGREDYAGLRYADLRNQR